MGFHEGSSLLVVLQLAAGIFALLTSLRVRRDYQVAQAPSLARFAIGFFLLAASQLAAAVLEWHVSRNPDVVATGFDAYDLLFIAYYGCLLGGLALVFSSFGRRAFRWTPAAIPLLWVGPVLQFVAILFLFFVVLHAGLNHIARARPGSLQTAAGFFLLLLGHFLFLFTYLPLSPRSVGGEIATLAGYTVLYLAVVRPRGDA